MLKQSTINRQSKAKKRSDAKMKSKNKTKQNSRKMAAILSINSHHLVDLYFPFSLSLLSVVVVPSSFVDFCC